MMTSAFGDLERLARDGDIRLGYVIGPARTNSTVVARLFGRHADAVIYEPALPVSPIGREHYARTLLAAYRRLRRQVVGRPVDLVVKDLSLFVDPGMLDFIDEHAARVVVTIREPAAQHASLVRQMRHEFSIPQRIDALMRYPVEVTMLLLAWIRLGPQFGRTAKRVLGPGVMGPAGRAIAGWNIESWQKLEAQLQRLSCRTDRCTILDASQMRQAPDAAAAVLDDLAQQMGFCSKGTPLEIAAHSRMRPRSAWAQQALRSVRIEPQSKLPTPVPPLPAPLTAALAPIYRQLLADPRNPLAGLDHATAGFSPAA